MSNVKLDKTSWELVDIIKETTKKNLTSAVVNNQLKLEKELLPTLLKLIDASTSEAYNKSYKNFSTKFEKISHELFLEDTSTLKKRK